MAGFNLAKPKAVATESKSAPLKDAAANVEAFISASPDVPPHPGWQVPIDGKNWVRRERSVYNLFLSPPQKRAFELIATLNHSPSMQEHIIMVLERVAREELERLSAPEISGQYASEARAALEYLKAWGDTTIGRKSRGQRPGF